MEEGGIRIFRIFCICSGKLDTRSNSTSRNRKKVNEGRRPHRSFRNYFRFRAEQIVDCTLDAPVSPRDSFTAIQP